MVQIENVLRQPIVTEKTVATKNKYTFLVHPDATKNDVKKAMKEFYGIEVENIHITKVPEKTRVIGRGRTLVRRTELKKAVVSVKKGEIIDFNAFK